MADRVEVGDLARIDAGVATDPTKGTIQAGTDQLEVADAADYANGETLKIDGAGPNGTDLFSTISSVTGRTVTLSDLAKSSVTNTDVGRAEDATGITCTVTTPSGAQTAPGVAHDGVGRYHANYTTTEPGIHSYEFVAVGAASAVITGDFEVFPRDQVLLSPQALATVGELKQFIGNVAGGDEGRLVAALNASTEKILGVSGRELVARNAVRNPTTGAVTVAAEARRFPVDRTLVATRILWVGDLSAAAWTGGGALELSAVATESATPAALETADLIYQPANRAADEPITHILIPTSISLTYGQQLEVTAIWGFPSVPYDIHEACLQLAMGSYLRTQKRTARAVDETGQDLPRTLIGAALRTAQDYANILVG